MARRRNTQLIAAKSLADIPVGVHPKRYISSALGYVVLRWPLGNNRTLEAFEHRYVMGFPDGVVHHRNGVKTDNRPENLEVLSVSEHTRVHHSPKWDLNEAASLYRQGLTVTAIADMVGVHHVTVFRGLQRHGVAIRPRGRRAA